MLLPVASALPGFSSPARRPPRLQVPGFRSPGFRSPGQASFPARRHSRLDRESRSSGRELIPFKPSASLHPVWRKRQPPVHEATGGHGFEGTISLPSSSIRLCFAVILARNWASWCSHRQNPPSAHGIGLPGARIAQIAPPRTDLASLVLASPKSPLRARNWPP